MKISAQLSHIPDTSGIYLFFNAKKECVYVGKATSLKQRVRSYFQSTGTKTFRPVEQMIHEIQDIRWKETDSVLEAIILEANKIKRLQPKYNVEGKDDKSWNYIGITDGEYPQIITIRQHEMQAKYGISDLGFQISDLRRDINLQSAFYNLKYLFGPFPGLNMREMMKTLRRLFFVSDCANRQSKHDKQIRQIKQSKRLSTMRNLPTAKPCLYYQMGQCLGVCTGEISPAEYRKKVIRPLVAFLKGGKKQVIVSLEKEMKRASKEERFEEAGRLRNQIARLRRIQDVALLNKGFIENNFKIQNSKFKISRIEGYDISNLGSSGKVGSMVVFDQHGPVKSEYRKFKIKTVKGQSDVDCLEEILRRRIKHGQSPIPDATVGTSSNLQSSYFWPLPDVILVDGGKPQVNTAKKVLEEFGVSIPVIGIAKGPERKRNDIHLGSKDRNFVRWVGAHQQLLIRVRDEAHRFAIEYQRKTRRIIRISG